MDSASVTATGFHESMDLDPLLFAILVYGGHNIEETKKRKRVKEDNGTL